MAVKYPSPNLPKFGKGSVLLDLYSNGSPSGRFFHIGNATKMEIDPGVSLEQLEQMINATPSVVAEAPKSIKPTVSITGTDFKATALQVALAAAGISPLDVSAGSVTAEPLASASISKLGGFFPLANRSVDTSTIAVKQGEGTSFVFNQVEVAEGQAVYFYTSKSGPTPRVGQLLTVTGFSTGGNNVTAQVITGVELGSTGYVSVAATTQADETHAGAGSTGSSTTLVLGTDYTVQESLVGVLIYFPQTSGLDDSAAVTVDYSKVDGHFLQLAGLTVPFIKCAIRFEPDATDGQQAGVEIWHVNLTPAAANGMIEDTYGNWQVKGSVLDDTANHPTAPYYLVTVPKDTN